jgi:ribonuclease HI
MERKHTFIVSASYDASTKITGIGIALHQADKPKRNGILTDEIKEGYIGVPVKIIEMFAVYRALEIASERSYEIVRVRSAYNAMRTRLKESYEHQVGFQDDDLHGEIMRLSEDFKLVQFSYKARRKNQMARQLAKEAKTTEAPIIREDLRNVFLQYEYNG